MTELEYVDATNLGLVRAIEAALRDVLPVGNISEVDLKEVRSTVAGWREVLNCAAQIDE